MLKFQPMKCWVLQKKLGTQSYLLGTQATGLLLGNSLGSVSWVKN